MKLALFFSLLLCALWWRKSWACSLVMAKISWLNNANAKCHGVCQKSHACVPKIVYILCHLKMPAAAQYSFVIARVAALSARGGGGVKYIIALRGIIISKYGMACHCARSTWPNSRISSLTGSDKYCARRRLARPNISYVMYAQ